jgi:hypothetical protein
MIVCRKCSRRYADGTEFCACGAYLEFDGEHVAEAGEPPPAVVPRGSDATPTSRASSWNLPPDGPVSSRPPAASSNVEPAPWSGLPGETTWAARPAHDVDARLPDVPVQTEAVRPVWVEPTARAGDVPCPQCATPNAPQRVFCRHCGSALVGSVAAATSATGATRIPWWRRLGRNARRRAKNVDASSLAVKARRLSRGGVAGRTVAFRSGMVALITLGLFSYLGPWQSTVMSGTRKLLRAERYEPISRSDILVLPLPTPGIEPTRFPLQGHLLAVDDFKNTAWATRWIGSEKPGEAAVPTGEECAAAATDTSLVFTFPDGADLERVRILGGRWAEDPARTMFSRPRLVELKVGDDCGYIVLTDDGELSTHTFKRKDVERLELRIIDIFGDPALSRTVEIAAIVFERRR